MYLEHKCWHSTVSLKVFLWIFIYTRIILEIFCGYKCRLFWRKILHNTHRLQLKTDIHSNLIQKLKSNRAPTLLQVGPSSLMMPVYHPLILQPNQWGEVSRLDRFTRHHIHSSPLWSQSLLMGISTQWMRASADCKLISDLIPPVGMAAWLFAALYRSRWPDGMV